MEPIDLAHKRRVKKAEEESDSRYQEPEDVLKIILDDVKTGKLKPVRMMIVWEEENEHYGHCSSKVSLIESLGLLDVIKDVILTGSNE